MPKLALLLLLSLLFCAACAHDHVSTIFTTWKAKKVELHNTSGSDFETQSTNVSDFGSAMLTINRDSTYEVSIEVLKDLTMKEKVFGNEVSEVVVPAVYKTMRRGTAVIRDSSITLLDAKHAIFVAGIFKVWPKELTVTFTDSHHQTWWSSWEEDPQPY